MDAGENGADAPGAGRQHEAPGRGHDGAPLRALSQCRSVVGATGDAGDYQDRSPVHIVGEVLRRIADAFLNCGANRVVVLQVGCGRGRLGVLLPAFAIQVGQRHALVGVGDHHEVPVLAIAGRRSLLRHCETLADNVVGHRTVEIQALADGASSGEQFVRRKVVNDRHGKSAPRSRNGDNHNTAGGPKILLAVVKKW